MAAERSQPHLAISQRYLSSVPIVENEESPYRASVTSSPVRAQIVLFDGFDPLDAVAPYEVLWAVELFAPGAITVEFAAVDGPRAVASGTGITVPATAVLDVEAADL